MSVPRAARRLLLPLTVVAAGLLLPATPAAAAGGITSPGPDEVVSAHAVLPLRAFVDGPAAGPSELILIEPATDVEQVVAVSTSPQGGELAYDLDSRCASSVCTEPAPARNGTWTLRLRGGATDERTFVLRIPPATPVEVVASPSGSGVRLEWALGAEADLTGYTVEDLQGLVVGEVGVEACDAAGRCRVEVPAQAGAWSVRAFRRTCPDCVTTLPSPASDPVRADAAAGSPLTGPVAPATPPATREPRPPVPGQREAFSRFFGAAPPADLPPPLTGSSAPLAAQADGAYDLELGYDAPPAGTAPEGESVGQALTALSTGDRMRLVVLSGLLVGSALWLRRWARRAIED